MKRRMRFLQFVVAGVSAGLLSACTANKAPSKVETALANMAKDVVIPIEAEDLQSPLAETPEVVEEGRKIYNQSCALCHGMDGHAATEMGRAMYPPAMDLTSPHVQHWNGAELFWIIQNGVRLTGMPAWKNMLSVTDTWKIVRFIHGIPRLKPTGEAQKQEQAAAPKTPEQLIAYGKTLYRQEGCFMCHQLNGEGGKVGPDLTMEGERGRSDEWLIGHFKDPQAYSKGSIMPAFRNLTDEQLRALTTFLQGQKGPTKSKSEGR
jgi:mono/diheme cytochrome c family protein